MHFPKYCGAGEQIVISAWDGDDYVAVLASNPGGGGVASDGDAARTYAAIVAMCRDAGEEYPLSVDGDFATAAELYEYCVHAEIDLGEGENEAHGTSGPEWMIGGSETDALFGNGGCDILIGGEGNDLIECGNSGAPVCDTGSPVNACTASGRGGEDHILGTRGKDHLYGGTGADFIDGMEGDDVIEGGKGNDYLFGSQGHDLLNGGYGDDVLSGGTDRDSVYGEGQDTMHGDVFYCRSDAHADPVHDWRWGDPVFDCWDAFRSGIETTEAPDPYVDWATRFDHVVQRDDGGRSIFNTYHTTSSRELLLDAWLGGASILMQEGGAIPLGGRFCQTGCPSPIRDGVAYFLSGTGEWLFDHDLDGTVDEVVTGFGAREARPFAGDFDGDGLTDIGYFDPVELEAYVDESADGLDGVEDRTYPLSAFLAGDLPVAGQFDGAESKAQLVFFRPGTRQWILAEESGTPVILSAMTGETEPGAMPLAVDVDCDAVDDPAVFDRHRQDVWEYWDTVENNDHDTVYWHGGHVREYPIVGDFGPGGSSCRNDIGLVDPSTGDIVVRYDGLTAAGSEWVVDLSGTVPPDAASEADPLHTRRIQSPLTCGPGSLEMVFRYVGITVDVDAGQLALPQDLSIPAPSLVVIPTWSPTAGLVSVGYRYSVEHIMYDAYHEMYHENPGDWPPATENRYLVLGSLSLLDPLEHGNPTFTADWFRMDYDAGFAVPGSILPPNTIQTWAMAGPGVGTEIEDGDVQPTTLGRRLAGVANRANDARGRHFDARPVHVPEVDYYREIIRGFIDHGIPLLVGVDQGGHFNAVIGYWELPSGVFFVYTADPVDGAFWWNYADKAMRWQRFRLTQGLIDADLLGGPMIFNHSDEGCVPGAWAWEIDDQFRTPGTGLLCGYSRAI